MGCALRPVEICLQNAIIVSAHSGLYYSILSLIEAFYLVNAQNNS